MWEWDRNQPLTLQSLAWSRLSDRIVFSSIHLHLLHAQNGQNKLRNTVRAQQLLMSPALAQTAITPTGEVPGGIMGTLQQQNCLARCTDLSDPMPPCTNQQLHWLLNPNPIFASFQCNFMLANNLQGMTASTSYANERRLLFVVVSRMQLLALQFYLCSSYQFTTVSAAGFLLPSACHRSVTVAVTALAPFPDNVTWNTGDRYTLQTMTWSVLLCPEILDSIQHLMPVQRITGPSTIAVSAKDDVCSFSSQSDISFTETSSTQVTELADSRTGEMCTELKFQQLEEDSCVKEVAFPSDTLDLRADSPSRSDVSPLSAADNVVDQVQDGLESFDAPLSSLVELTCDEQDVYARFYNWLIMESWVEGFYVSEVGQLCIIVMSGTLMDVAARNLISSGFGRLNWVLVDSTDSCIGNYIESAVPSAKVPRQAVRGPHAAHDLSVLCPPGKILLTPGARIQIGQMSAFYAGWLGGSGLNKKLGVTVGHIYNNQSAGVDCRDIFLDDTHTRVGQTLLYYTGTLAGLCFADIALFEIDENVFPVNELHGRQFKLTVLNLKPLPTRERLRIVIGDREGLLSPFTIKRLGLYGAVMITDCDKRDQLTGPGDSGSPVAMYPGIDDLAVLGVPAMVTGYIDGPLPGHAIHLPSARSFTIACLLRPALNAIESNNALKAKLVLGPSGTLTGVDFGDLHNIDSGYFT